MADEYFLDFALKYENYDNDLVRLCKTLGISLKDRKHTDHVLRERYNNISEYRAHQIAKIVGVATACYAASTGNTMPFDTTRKYDEAEMKLFLGDNLSTLKGFFLNNYQEKKAEAFLDRAFDAHPEIRKTDYRYYYECEEKDEMINHIQSHCPFMLDRFSYGFE